MFKRSIKILAMVLVLVTVVAMFASCKQDDTPETLQRRIMEEAEWKILPEAVRLFCDGRLTVRDNKVYID